jgi:hypothetical protein
MFGDQQLSALSDYIQAAPGMETIFVQNISTTCDSQSATTQIIDNKTNKDRD